MSDPAFEARTAFLIRSLVAITVVFAVLGAGAPRALDRLAGFVESKRFWIPISLFILCAFFILLCINAVYPGYLDRGEPSIAAVSWIVLKGAPLYHSLDSAARYALLYGPTSYLPYMAALWLGGGTALSLKGAILVINVVTIYFLWRLYRTLFEGSVSLLLTAIVLIFLHVPRPNHYLFQVRSDVLIVCGTVIGLFAATSASRFAGPLTVALATGFVMDTKASGFLYMIPVLALLVSRRGWRTTSLVAVGSLLAAALPFLLPNVSASLYLQWIHRASRHPRDMANFLPTIRTLPILALPLLLIVGPTPWRNGSVVRYVSENRVRLLALGLCIAGALVTSSRIGAGSHHILPFVPVLAYEYALLYKGTTGAFANWRPMVLRYFWVCTAVIVVMRSVGGLWEILSPWSDWSWASAVTDDLHSILRKYPSGSVEMGYGEKEEGVTFFRPELVFATNRLTLDTPALCDMDVDGIALPQATVDSMTACATDVWLIPKGETPFALQNIFGVSTSEFRRPIFSPAFREAFAQHYRKETSTAYFDVWTCASPPPPPAS